MFLRRDRCWVWGGGSFLRGLDGAFFRISRELGVFYQKSRFLSHNSFGKLRKSEKLVTHTIKSHFGPKKLKNPKKLVFQKKMSSSLGVVFYYSHRLSSGGGGSLLQRPFGENISSSIMGNSAEKSSKGGSNSRILSRWLDSAVLTFLSPYRKNYCPMPPSAPLVFSQKFKSAKCSLMHHSPLKNFRPKTAND